MNLTLKRNQQHTHHLLNQSPYRIVVLHQSPYRIVTLIVVLHSHMGRSILLLKRHLQPEVKIQEKSI